MKFFRYAAASMIMAAASFSTLSYAAAETTQPARADANECTVSADPSITPTGTASKPPVLSVGVTDPNTKLNLPWFLTDMINAVNTHQSAHCFVRALRSGI
ncbi:hypothetical protein DWV00_19535 [Trinickia dinghuensis]|uniref:Uncharacterized protein n=2 Tax=Trinickia dinghuensis TaxID=2291023 RepID=A0A3D8JWA8_9BURK|nr:hypothetical protein DWV00_19535 [Trinickia dinghuensis]